MSKDKTCKITPPVPSAEQTYFDARFEFVRPGDSVRAIKNAPTAGDQCANGSFSRLYEGKNGKPVAEYFCTRGGHFHGVRPDDLRINVPKSALKQRAKEAQAKK